MGSLLDEVVDWLLVERSPWDHYGPVYDEGEELLLRDTDTSDEE